jgi:hypothetical protein
VKGGLALVGGVIAVVTWAVAYNGLQWLVGAPAFPFQIGLASSLIPGSQGGDAPQTPSRGQSVGAATAKLGDQAGKAAGKAMKRPKNKSPHVGRRAA